MAIRLVVLALVMEAVYLLFARSWWLWDHLGVSEATPPLFSVKELVWYGLGLTLLFALYAAACWMARQGTSRWTDIAVFVLPVFFVVTLLPTVPVTSSDVFHYIMEGRTFWVHGENPLVTVPSAFPDDPYLPLVSPWHQSSPAPYGPLWIMLTGLPSLIPQDQRDLVLIGYKLLPVLFYAGTAWLVWLILSRQAPERRRLGVIFYAWNPLIILSVVVNGHNDAVMMFFAILAVYLALRDRWVLALPVLILAVLSKYVALLLAPLFLYYGWQRLANNDRKQLLLGGFFAVAVAVVLFAPLWEGFDSFKAMRADQRSWFVHSIPELALFVLSKAFSLSVAMQLARVLGALAFLPFYLFLLIRLRPSPSGLMVGAYHALFLYLMLASTVFYPWYVTWVLTLGAITVWSPWSITAMVLSFTAPFADIIERLITSLHYLGGRLSVETGLVFLLVLTPPMLVWAALAWRDTSWRFTRGAPGLVPEYET